MDADGDSADAGAVVNLGSVTVRIRCSNGTNFSAQIALDSTVESFKAALAEKCHVPAEQQRLIYEGRILKDDQTLESYGVESDHTIHLVRGFALPTAPANPAAANHGASRTLNSNSGVARGVGSNEGRGFGGAGFGGSLFSGLGSNDLVGSGTSGLFGTGFSEFDHVQQQLTQNPNIMRELLNMPVIQNMMNNPDLMRNLIMSNPQMQEIIDRNPDLAHVLNDPSTLRQTLEAARNPELMREMMRNTDRAMSNIESSPEGFNMLRRMYETVQEPFLNATTMAGDTGSDFGSNPLAALLGNQDTAQSRDQSSNPSTTSSEATTGPNTSPLPNPWGNAAGGTQTTSTRSTPASDARTPSIAGLGGLGFPDFERMAGSMPDSSLLNQVMQNPAMAQMMQSLSDPQHMNQIFNMNAQIRSRLDSNAQLREMLQNPEFLGQLASPETLQHRLSLHQSLFGRQQSSQGQNPTVGGTVPPDQLYATQLSQLQEMGFFDTQENIRALSATAGNVHAAVERLLRNLGQ